MSAPGPRDDTSGATFVRAGAGRELAEVTLAAIGDGVIRTDSRGRVDYINPAAVDLTGWQRMEAMGHPLSEVYPVVVEATRRARRDPVELCRAEKRTVVTPGLFTLRSRGGEERIIRDTVSPLLDEDGQLLGVVVVFRDLTQVRSLEREMAYISSHDTVTGFLTRQDFEIYVEAALEGSRDRDDEHALLFIDLLELKLVNDAYGHVAGDELLRQVSDVLRECTDENAVLGRVGGGDFSLLLPGHAVADAHAIARHLHNAIRDFRFAWGGQNFEVGFTIGVVLIDSHADSVPQLLKAAENASYLARQQGRNKIHVHDPATDPVDERRGRLHWLQRLRRALADDRFVLYQQRIVPLGDERPLHEILVRMLGENGEIIPPGAFIPVAESYDLATLLDRWVTRRAIELLRSSKTFTDAAVSINLSGQSLGDDGFLEDLLGYVRSSGIDTERLYFEITETNAVANLNRALRFIAAVRDLGCRFILDDFGSGFSSYRYLKNLPVNILKIDGEFVREMTTDPIPRAMVTSINEIGHLMGLTTIAEWVEDDATLELSRELGVDYVQGYGLHRPEPIQG